MKRVNNNSGKKNSVSKNQALPFHFIVGISALITLIIWGIVVIPGLLQRDPSDIISDRVAERTFESSIIQSVDTREKVIAFTVNVYDSGEEHRDLSYISLLSESLLAAHIPVTVFVSGQWVETHQESTTELMQLREIEWGNFSYDNRTFHGSCFDRKLLPETDKDEALVKAQSLITNITGGTPTVFRFPGNCYDAADIQKVKEIGLTPIGGTVLESSTLPQPGMMIIFDYRDDRRWMESFVQQAQREGYTFLTISDLLR